MQQWQPDRVFDRVDFQNKKSEDKTKKKNPPALTSSDQKANIQAWKPRSIHEQPAQQPVKRSAAKIQEPKPVQKGISKPQFDMTRKMLVESVLMLPAESAEILRSWYWEKPGKATSLRNIPVENRIFVVLKSLPEKILETLYSYMTPIERKQMQEIREKRHHVTAAEILNVRQAFINRLSES